MKKWCVMNEYKVRMTSYVEADSKPIAKGLSFGIEDDSTADWTLYDSTCEEITDEAYEAKQ